MTASLKFLLHVKLQSTPSMVTANQVIQLQSHIVLESRSRSKPAMANPSLHTLWSILEVPMYG